MVAKLKKERREIFIVGEKYATVRALGKKDLYE